MFLKYFKIKKNKIESIKMIKIKYMATNTFKTLKTIQVL